MSKYWIPPFCETLKGLMSAKKINQTQLAKLSGIHVRNIGYYLREGREPRLNSALELSKGLGCPLDDLYPIKKRSGSKG